MANNCILGTQFKPFDSLYVGSQGLRRTLVFCDGLGPPQLSGYFLNKFYLLDRRKVAHSARECDLYGVFGRSPS